jgi:Sulfotransferase family
MNDPNRASSAETLSGDGERAPHLLPICPNPVFVIGSPRSGTTVLARSLGLHSELWASAESEALFHLFGPANLARRAFDREMALPGPRWLGREEVSREEFVAYIGAGVNALFTSRSQGLRWIDHTPIYTLIAPSLAEALPGASFIHILRDGRDVVNSMLGFVDSRSDPKVARFAKARIAWATDMADACETWRDHVDAGMNFCDESADRAMVVSYEDLVAAPEATFGAIHGFLGVADEEAPARFLASRRINSSFGGTPRRSPSEIWDGWGEEQRRTFARIAGPTMLRFGFATRNEMGTLSAPPS